MKHFIVIVILLFISNSSFALSAPYHAFLDLPSGYGLKEFSYLRIGVSAKASGAVGLLLLALGKDRFSGFMEFKMGQAQISYGGKYVIFDEADDPLALALEAKLGNDFELLLMGSLTLCTYLTKSSCSWLHLGPVYTPKGLKYYLIADFSLSSVFALQFGWLLSSGPIVGIRFFQKPYGAISLTYKVGVIHLNAGMLF
jgi:hypothetical protein